MTELYPDAAAALDGFLHDDITIASGQFGLCGIPERLTDAIVASGVNALTIASNNAGIDHEVLGKLLRTRQVAKLISSRVGDMKELERRYLSGELKIEFCPQGAAPSGCAPAAGAFPAYTRRRASARMSLRGRK